MAVKSFKELLDKARNSSTYWAETLKLEFAISLSALMERKNISKTDLAQRAGFSAAYVSKALRGDQNFTIDSLAKLAHVLDAHVKIELEDHKFYRLQSHAFYSAEVVQELKATPRFCGTAFTPSAQYTAANCENYAMMSNTGNQAA